MYRKKPDFKPFLIIPTIKNACLTRQSMTVAFFQGFYTHYNLYFQHSKRVFSIKKESLFAQVYNFIAENRDTR